jgi:hypothetical protein
VDKEEGKIVVKDSKRTEFEEAKKEMHRKLLEEHFKEKIESDKYEMGNADMKYSILPDGKNNYKVRIYHNDSSDDRQFL